jgi:hypothetical protein
MAPGRRFGAGPGRTLTGDLKPYGEESGQSRWTRAISDTPGSFLTGR